MKNLKIIALVIAAHVAGLAVLLTVQGCRSTTASSEQVAAASHESVAPVAPVARAGEPAFKPIAVNVPAPATPAQAMPPADRFAPTRPGSPGAAEVQPAQNYTVKKNDNLGAIARRHGVTKEELIRANNLSSSTILKIGQQLVIPAPKPAGATGATGAAGASAGGTTYKVRSGDTLGGIAKRHGVTAAALRVANGLRGDAITAGQELKIPTVATPSTGGPAFDTPAAGNKPGAGSMVTGPDLNNGVVPPAGTKSGSSASASRGAGRHVVAQGETIESIGRRYKVSQVAIMTANNITNPKSIRPGQELIVPGAAGLAAPPQPAVEAPPPSLEPSSEPPPVKPASGADVPVRPIEDAPPVVPVQ